MVLRRRSLKSLKSRGPKAPRQRLENEERKAQLLARAGEVFAVKAYDLVSIDELAEAAGVSKGLLYHYFPTKRDLYVAVLRETSAALLARTVVDTPGLAPLARLRHGVSTYLEHVAAHPDSYRALMRGGIGSDPEVAAVIEATRASYIDHMLRAAEAAPLPVRPKEAPLLRIALRGWLGFVEATSQEWLAHRARVGAQELRDLLVDMFLASVQRAAGESLTKSW